MSATSFTPVQPSPAARLGSWLLLIILVVAAAATGWLMVQSWLADGDDISDLSFRLQRFEGSQQDPAPLEQMLKTLRQKRLVDSGYVDAADADQAGVAFEQTIAGLMAANQMQPTSLQHMPSTIDGPATALSIRVQGTAPSSAIVPFIRSLESASPSIDINELHLQRDPTGRMTFDASLRAFWIPKT